MAGMMMMKGGKQQVVALVMVVLVVAAGSGAASAASCNAGSLAACVPAITSGTSPTAGCCSNLKAQQSCFCQFAKNPAYGRYINSPNARRTVASCGLSVPRC
ncbi:hypothetical protein EJB05_08282, partial [Eragrostis curvula]